MSRIERVLGQAEDIVMGLFSAIAILIVFYQVVTRYFLPSMLTDWGGEVVIYLMITAVLIAGSPLVLGGRHIRADLFLRRMPHIIQWVLELLTLVVGLVYSALVVWFAIGVVEFAHMVDIRSSSSLQFPQWIFYLVLPFAFATMAMRYAIQVWRFLFHFQPGMLAGHIGETDIVEKSQS